MAVESGGTKVKFLPTDTTSFYDETRQQPDEGAKGLDQGKTEMGHISIDIEEIQDSSETPLLNMASEGSDCTSDVFHPGNNEEGEVHSYRSSVTSYYSADDGSFTEAAEVIVPRQSHTSVFIPGDDDGATTPAAQNPAKASKKEAFLPPNNSALGVVVDLSKYTETRKDNLVYYTPRFETPSSQDTDMVDGIPAIRASHSVTPFNSEEVPLPSTSDTDVLLMKKLDVILDQTEQLTARQEIVQDHLQIINQDQEDMKQRLTENSQKIDKIQRKTKKTKCEKMNTWVKTIGGILTIIGTLYAAWEWLLPYITS